jgi:hypothetical protein
MLLGHFELAWRESDAIRRRGAPDPHRFWQGEALRDTRVILRCLHGFGDAVQFLRYVPRLRNVASRVVVEVPPRFRDLAAYFDGVEEVVTWGEDVPIVAPEWDVQIESNELPFVFRTQLSDLPLATNYLKLPIGGACNRAVAVSSRDVLRVGLAWTAGAWDPKRSIPFSVMQSLLEVDGCEVWSLEANLETIDSNSSARRRILHDDACRNSIRALAAKISTLDLVITVDTLAAHLAGALGRPTWLLLQHEADWRWLHRVDSSPWYPSFRLFRQAKAGDWRTVISATEEALGTWLRNANRYGVVA